MAVPAVLIGWWMWPFPFVISFEDLPRVYSNSIKESKESGAYICTYKIVDDTLFNYNGEFPPIAPIKEAFLEYQRIFKEKSIRKTYTKYLEVLTMIHDRSYDYPKGTKIEAVFTTDTLNENFYMGDGWGIRRIYHKNWAWEEKIPDTIPIKLTLGKQVEVFKLVKQPY